MLSCPSLHWLVETETANRPAKSVDPDQTALGVDPHQTALGVDPDQTAPGKEQSDADLHFSF